MSTKMKRLSLHLRTFLLLIWPYLPHATGYECPYGVAHCRFEPAPRGRTPPCAQPGFTYCVDPDPYPEQLIRRLIEAGQYDIRTLLSDESRDEFSAKRNEYPYGYGPNSLPNIDQISLVNDNSYNGNFGSYNPDTFAQKTPLQPPSPVDPTPYNINTYQQSNFTKFFNDYSPPYYDVRPPYDYNRKSFRHTGAGLNPQSPSFQGFNPNVLPSNVFSNFDSGWFRGTTATTVTQYNPQEWWKYVSPSRSGGVSIQRSVSFPPQTTTARRKRRNAELVKASKKRKLNGAEALRIALGLANEEASSELERSRRQLPGVELCSSRTQFVTPRAALNNRGNWMYVVNMPRNMTQLVRAEICRSSGSECRLCTLPAGYSSSCQQKYIQKRLVALKPEGDNLITDLFWIPSCCQCSINKT